MFLSTQLMEGQGYTNYTVKDGLPSNHIYRCTQDANGFIWIVTDRGISKFDGTKFRNFTTDNGLPTNDIWNIRITKDNRVWYFSISDRLGYIENDIVYSFPASDDSVMLPVHISLGKNSIGFNGVDFEYTFNDSIWQRENRSFGIFQLSNDNVIGDRGIGYFQIKKDDRVLEGSYFRHPNSSVLRALINDSIFTGSADKASIIYDFKNEKGRQIKQDRGSDFPFSLKNNRFHQVNQEIQFTGENFLAILDGDFNWSKIHTIPEELNSHFSFEDQEGSIWAATFDNGLYKLPANYSTVKTSFKNREIELLEFIEDDLFVGVENGGIHSIHDDKISLFDDFDSYANSIFKSGDSIIVTYQMDLLTLNTANNKKTFRSGIARGKRFINHKGVLWSDGFSTLYKYAPNSFKSKTYANSYNHLFSQEGDLFTFQNKKLARYNETLDVFEVSGNFSVGAKVTAVQSYGNITYIGTEGDGLYVFKDQKLKKLQDGDNTFITAISEENENSIWVIVNGELRRYIIDNGKTIINRYPQINGFATRNLTKLELKDNVLYLGSKSGLHEFDIAGIKTTSNFDLYIDAISINDVLVTEESVITQYSSNQVISASFGALSFNAARPQYFYRLMPDNEHWLTTESGEVNLSNLNPGKYILQLKAIVNSEQRQKEIPITIRPLWFQTLLFKGITALLVLVCFGYLVYRITRASENKKRKRLAQEKKLSEIQLRALRTQMNPHFVFNSLAAIQYFFNENEIDKGDEYLVKFSRLIRQFFELADKKEIKISEEKQLLINYLDVEKLRFKDKFNYTIQVPKTLEQRTMPSMLLQPIVENAINHGIFNKETNGTVQIEFKSGDENRLIVSVTDDGVGYRKTQKGKDLRLKSSNVLEDRLFYLNQSGSWEIHIAQNEAFPDSEDCGHQTTFTIKPKKK